jgi:UDP-MurNAc hydroxylase
MEIKFVNHASTIFSKDGINLITDPWIEGKVFHDGWSLLSQTKFKYSDFKQITHIWFSHEHPDHFFPPNLKSIPLEYRKKITVLYHFTRDKKVIEFCKSLEFKEVVELTSNKEFELSPDFKIINTAMGINSWLYLKTNEKTFLNTNDCVINTPKIANRIFNTVGEIDVLLTQFSYAAKYGNADQPEQRKKAVDAKYHQMKLQIDTFKPKFFIPIASFVWFSHEENFYMNDEVNTIDRVEKFISDSGVTPIILYPEDTYIAGESHKNEISLNKYSEDTQKVKFENTQKTQSVEIDKIKESANALTKRVRKEDLFAFIILCFCPIKVYLTDLEKVVRFSILFGFKEINNKKGNANLFMTSEVLEYCFRFNWGFSSAGTNGRFKSVDDKGLALFNYFVAIGECLNHKDSIFNRALNKLFRNIKSVFQ